MSRIKHGTICCTQSPFYTTFSARAIIIVRFEKKFEEDKSTLAHKEGNFHNLEPNGPRNQMVKNKTNLLFHGWVI